jgi:hypothetical protein
MDYLVYVEHSAENLQFYIWYQDYVRRWNLLSASQRALSPEVQPDQTDYANLTRVKSASTDLNSPTARPKMVGEGWNANGMSFFLEDQEVNDDADTIVASSRGSPAFPTDADILAQAGLKWQPCMHQSLQAMAVAADIQYSYCSTYA